uniref:Aggrecan core protein n=1 Tax=Magallana gigas TaxID=29159 RepID=K1RCV0_MAGGI
MTNTFAFIVVVCVCMKVQVYSAGCRVGWIQFQSKCYWFSHESKPWGEAGVLDAMWGGFSFRTNVTGSAMTQDLGEKQSHDSRSWGEAEGLCYVFHSKLAEPLTDAESHFLISHSQVYPSSFWIGISDMIEEDRWIYSSNQNVIQVNGWFPGEPNGHTGENCVALEKSVHGKWIDVDCKRAYRFVCEADVK